MSTAPGRIPTARPASSRSSSSACWPASRRSSTGTEALTVSVVMPTKNRAQFLVAAVRALLAQTVMPDEFVIVDQSDDDTGARHVAALVAALPASERPKLVHVLDRTINGAAAARN